MSASLSCGASGKEVSLILCPCLPDCLGELRAIWTTVSASLSCGALGKGASLTLCPCLPDDLGELRAIWTTVSASLSGYNMGLWVGRWV